jgi:hypothetical protein
MEQILRFLQTYEIWIYVLLGFIAVIYIRKLVGAWHEWRSTVFGMEREATQKRFSSALAITGLLGIMILAQFMLVTFIVPNFPRGGILPTATIDLLATPTTGLPDETIVVTQVGGATAAATVSSVADGCVPGQLEWTGPVAGDEIQGAIELKGTVNVANLGFYKFEFNQMGSDTWVTIAAGNQPKVDEALGGIWNTGQLIPGDYQLRLIVTDNQGQMLPACSIQVRIISP